MSYPQANDGIPKSELEIELPGGAEADARFVCSQIERTIVAHIRCIVNDSRIPEIRVMALRQLKNAPQEHGRGTD